MSIPKNDIETFLNTLQKSGFGNEAGTDWKQCWELKSKSKENLLSDGFVPFFTETCSVSVKRLVNGKEKTYDDSNGTDWNSKFSDDLKSGYFGRSPSLD